MGHVVLLGDSIFDNARYVPDRPAVIEQLRSALPAGWLASLLAVDGHTAKDVVDQVRDLPSDATHLVVSAGGNDALGEVTILSDPAHRVGEALGIVHEARTRFRRTYRAMLLALSLVQKPTTVCTIYDTIPGLGPAEQTALAGFNELILREASAAGLPVVDLRVVCGQVADYSHVSSIEPSTVGGAKIVRTIIDVLTMHDFSCRRSVLYT